MGRAVDGWGTGRRRRLQAARAALAVHPRSVGRAGQRGHGPADPGGPGGARPTSRFLDRFPTPPLRLGAARATCSGPGRASATTGGPATCTGRRSAWWPTTAAGCPPTWPGCSALPGVGAYTARAVLAFAFEAGRRGGGHQRRPGAVAGGGRPTGAVPARPSAWSTPWCRPGGAGGSARPSSIWGPESAWPATPRCQECPIRRRCRWAATGRTGPDPAVGSAGVSVPQSRFAGSDRQGRGRLVDALRRGPVPVRGPWPRRSGWPDDPDRADRVVAGLVAEGTGGPDGRRGPAPALSGAPVCSQALRPVTNRTMWSLTSSGRSTCRKWPAPSTTTISEPGARKSVTGPMVSMPMQPSSAPWRYRVGWGAMVPPAAWAAAAVGVVGWAGEHGPVVADGGGQALGGGQRLLDPGRVPRPVEAG